MSSNVILTNQQNEILEKVKTGSNLLITGGAGTGKSFIVKHILKELKSCGRQTLVTASTGVAANLIKGVTCHRAFQIPKKNHLGIGPDSFK